MDKKELRINNIVGANLAGYASDLSDFSDLELKIFHSQGVTLHRVYSGSDIDNANWYFPIKLTEDILLAFGFVKGEKVINRLSYGFNGAESYNNLDYFQVFIYNDKYHYIIDENSDDYGCHYTSEEIKYIHQLQNIHYAITGKELELNIVKS